MSLSAPRINVNFFPYVLAIFAGVIVAFVWVYHR